MDGHHSFSVERQKLRGFCVSACITRKRVNITTVLNKYNFFALKTMYICIHWGILCFMLAKQISFQLKGKRFLECNEIGWWADVCQLIWSVRVTFALWNWILFKVNRYIYVHVKHLNGSFDRVGMCDVLCIYDRPSSILWPRRVCLIMYVYLYIDRPSFQFNDCWIIYLTCILFDTYSTFF